MISCGELLHGIVGSHSISQVNMNALVSISTKSNCYNRYLNHKTKASYPNLSFITQFLSIIQLSISLIL